MQVKVEAKAGEKARWRCRVLSWFEGLNRQGLSGQASSGCLPTYPPAHWPQRGREMPKLHSLSLSLIRISVALPQVLPSGLPPRLSPYSASMS